MISSRLQRKTDISERVSDMQHFDNDICLKIDEAINDTTNLLLSISQNQINKTASKLLKKVTRTSKRKHKTKGKKSINVMNGNENVSFSKAEEYLHENLWQNLVSTTSIARKNFRNPLPQIQFDSIVVVLDTTKPCTQYKYPIRKPAYQSQRIDINLLDVSLKINLLHFPADEELIEDSLDINDQNLAVELNKEYNKIMHIETAFNSPNRIIQVVKFEESDSTTPTQLLDSEMNKISGNLKDLSTSLEEVAAQQNIAALPTQVNLESSHNNTTASFESDVPVHNFMSASDSSDIFKVHLSSLSDSDFIGSGIDVNVGSIGSQHCTDSNLSKPCSNNFPLCPISGNGNNKSILIADSTYNSFLFDSNINNAVREFLDGGTMHSINTIQSMPAYSVSGRCKSSKIDVDPSKQILLPKFSHNNVPNFTENSVEGNCFAQFIVADDQNHITPISDYNRNISLDKLLHTATNYHLAVTTTSNDSASRDLKVRNVGDPVDVCESTLRSQQVSFTKPLLVETVGCSEPLCGNDIPKNVSIESVSNESISFNRMITQVNAKQPKLTESSDNTKLISYNDAFSDKFIVVTSTLQNSIPKANTSVGSMISLNTDECVSCALKAESTQSNDMNESPDLLLFNNPSNFLSDNEQSPENVLEHDNPTLVNTSSNNNSIKLKESTSSEHLLPVNLLAASAVNHSQIPSYYDNLNPISVADMLPYSRIDVQNKNNQVALNESANLNDAMNFPSDIENEKVKISPISSDIKIEEFSNNNDFLLTTETNASKCIKEEIKVEPDESVAKFTDATIKNLQTTDTHISSTPHICSLFEVKVDYPKDIKEPSNVLISNLDKLNSNNKANNVINDLSQIKSHFSASLDKIDFTKAKQKSARQCDVSCNNIYCDHKQNFSNKPSQISTDVSTSSVRLNTGVKRLCPENTKDCDSQFIIYGGSSIQFNSLKESSGNKKPKLTAKSSEKCSGNKSILSAKATSTSNSQPKTGIKRLANLDAHSQGKRKKIEEHHNNERERLKPESTIINNPSWQLYKCSKPADYFMVVKNYWGGLPLPDPHKDLTTRFHTTPINFCSNFNITGSDSRTVECLSIYESQIDEVEREIRTIEFNLDCFENNWSKRSLRKNLNELERLKSIRMKLLHACEEANRFYLYYRNHNTGWNAWNISEYQKNVVEHILVNTLPKYSSYY